MCKRANFTRDQATSDVLVRLTHGSDPPSTGHCSKLALVGRHHGPGAWQKPLVLFPPVYHKATFLYKCLRLHMQVCRFRASESPMFLPVINA